MSSQFQSPAGTSGAAPMGSRPYARVEETDALRSQDFSESIGNIKRRLGLVLTCIAFGAGLATFVSLFLMPRYTAKALLLVNGNEMSEPRRADDNIVDTHVALLISHAHLDNVLAEIQKDPDLAVQFPRTVDIEKRLKVLQEMRSRLIGVNFTATSPEAAAKVANIVASLYVKESQSAGNSEAQSLEREFSRQAYELEGQLTQAESDLRNLGAIPNAEPAAAEALRRRIDVLKQQIAETNLRQNLTRRQEESRKQNLALSPPIGVYALARPPEQTSSIRPIFIVIPAAIASALFGIALAVIRGRLDTRVHDVAGLRRVFSVPCVGAAPPKPRKRSATGAARKSAHDYDRALEAIAASVFLAPDTGPKAIVMVANADHTPSRDFALDFAASASRFKRTLFVDLVETIDDNPKNGAGKKDPQSWTSDAIKKTTFDGPYISLARHQTGLLALAASGKLAETLTLLNLDYDWVILASPSMAHSPVSRVVARMVDKVILTVRAKTTNYEDVAEALRNLAPFRADLDLPGAKPAIAFVMTDLPAANRGAPVGPHAVEASDQRPTEPPARNRGDAGGVSAGKETDEKASAKKEDVLLAGAIK